jgi:hypothetical protein
MQSDGSTLIVTQRMHIGGGTTACLWDPLPAEAHLTLSL